MGNESDTIWLIVFKDEAVVFWQKKIWNESNIVTRKKMLNLPWIAKWTWSVVETCTKIWQVIGIKYLNFTTKSLSLWALALESLRFTDIPTGQHPSLKYVEPIMGLTSVSNLGQNLKPVFFGFWNECDLERENSVSLWHYYCLSLHNLLANYQLS